MNIYIGNMSFDTTEDQLRQAFTAFGEVSTVNIITDKYSGEPRGFAFVEMSSKSEAIAAISDGEISDLDIKEIAHILNISIGAVKSNLCYARKNIREKMQKSGYIS